MIKKIFLIMILFSAVLHSQYTNDPYQFFPANIGDRWEYTWAGPNQIYTVVRDSIDTRDSSRIIFYNSQTTYNTVSTQSARYRIDKSYNVFYLPLSDNWHLYKLDTKIDAWWIVRAEEYKAAKVLDIFQAYVFGKLTTIKTIGFYLLTRGDTVITENSILQYWEKLAYGFGLISREDEANATFFVTWLQNKRRNLRNSRCRRRT